MVAMGPEKMKENNPVAALSEMMDMIDASPKTVVAALNGPALGGGGEVSLACHYRVADGKASIGFPEARRERSYEGISCIYGTKEGDMQI